MSPQALKLNSYSEKSDIWSFGVLFYEILFGTTPWTALTEKDLIVKIETTPVVFPNDIKVSDESKEFI